MLRGAQTAALDAHGDGQRSGGQGTYNCKYVSHTEEGLGTGATMRTHHQNQRDTYR
jgi:hypothetical protein